MVAPSPSAVKPQNQTPKAPAPKSKNKHRRSFDFDDIQELKARSPTLEGGSTPKTPTSKIPSPPRPSAVLTKGKPWCHDLTLNLEPHRLLAAAY
ncbi:hypothetical protein CPB86DRAFT_461205 [Serendipita vermifera]|nr:hypothetical protein CPB86DRAFT_461205 [Serendipita vermifera]